MTRLRPLLALLPLLAAAPALADGPVVTILRWDGRASLAGLRGPGTRMFRLDAVVSWSAAAPREASRYAVRLSLPDGSVITEPLPTKNAPPSRSLSVLVPADMVQNLRPEAVRVAVTIVDASTGAALGESRDATILDFANPGPGVPEDERGPFGWGDPLEVPEPGAAPLPRRAPSGLPFLRVRPGGDVPGFFLAATEASNAQVASALPDYDPRAARSDDFRLEESDQPAVGLSPKRTREFLDALGKADPTGLAYRLPTEAEWLAAAKSGRPSAFWWGDDALHPEGANLLGPEPAQATDTTAPAAPSRGESGFRANPWGFFHTFGNVAEWATKGDAGLVRMGGHFRTEPVSPLPVVEGPEPGADGVGSDPYVGVRPALDLTAETGAAIARKALGADAFWSGVNVAFDPDRAAITLTGPVDAVAHRKLADERLSSLWFVAAVDNRLEGPGVAEGRLAKLDAKVLTSKRRVVLGRTLDDLTIPVRWAPELPVEGSRWYVNVYDASGRHFAHPLLGERPDPRGPLRVTIDRSVIGAAEGGVRVALSLGAPAPGPDAPSVASNVVSLP